MPSLRMRRAGALLGIAGLLVGGAAILVRLQTPSDALTGLWVFSDLDRTQIEMQLMFPRLPVSAPGTPAPGALHYTEHLAWQTIQDQDQRGDVTNAWTTPHGVGYYLVANADTFPSQLRNLFQVAQPLQVSEEVAAREVDIVLREYDLNVLENPFYHPQQEMTDLLYGDTFLAEPVLGTPETIAGLTLDQAKTLHAATHRLEAARLLIYGNVTAARARRAVNHALRELELAFEDLGSELKDRDLARSYPALDLPFSLEKRLVVERLADPTFIYRRLIPLPDCGGPAVCDRLAQVSEDLLGSALPGGLVKPLRYEGFITRNFSVHVDVIADAYVELGFVANPDVGITLAALQQAVETHLSHTLNHGVSDQTFARIRNRQVNSLQGEPNQVRYDFYQATARLQQDKSVLGRLNYLEALDTLTPDALNAFLKALDGPSRTVAFHLLPEN